MSVQKETLERRLTAADRHRIFQSLGFQINGKKPNEAGFVTGVKFPSDLGEGRHGNGSVNLETGAVKDFGSTDYKGDLYKVVMDVRSCTFPEALEWIAQASGYASRNGKPKRPTTKEKPKPVATLEKVERWHERLMGDTAEAKSARDYLTDARGIDPDLLRTQRVGLARDRKKRGGTWCTWWIVFPAGIEGDVVTSLKAFAYDPEMGDWMRSGDGRKICRNAGPTSLITLVRGDTGEPVVYLGGEVDAFSAHSVGFDVLTGTGGENPPKDEWLEEIAALADREFIVCFDGDEAGRKAAPKAARKLDEAGFTVRVADLPDGKDVNDLVVEGGREALKRVVDAAELYELPEPERGSDKSGPRKEMTQAERLLTYAEEGVELFHAPDGKAYASFEAGGAYRTAAISSAAFGKYLRRLFYQAEGRPPSAQALQDARDVMSAEAEFDGEEREVHLRVAGHGGRVYIDLANENWDLVEIDKGGWRIVSAENAPVRFRRTPGMKALPEPKRGGGLDLLRSHVRLMSDGEFALLLAWLVQALNPEGPYPALELTGEQGTGKSTTARLLRALIDPHRVAVQTRPREERDLMVAAVNSHLLSFDNLSGLPHWLSDAFCRLATGGGFRTRKLYTGREEEIFYAMRPLILNGIEDLTTRPDLADRTVTLRLKPISESERKTEKELRAKFDKDRPFILGALFDAVATALRNAQDVELETLPRMADFARWGAAAEEAFPTEEGTFLRAYAQGRREASEEAVESSTVASAIRAMLEDREEWTGKTSTLREDLKAYLPNPKKPPKDYPRTYQAMGAELRRLMPVLRDVGIEKEEDPRERSRAFTLRKITRGNEADEANEADASPSTGQNGPSERAHPPVKKRTPERVEADGSARHEHELSPSDDAEADWRAQRAHRSLQMPHQSKSASTSADPRHKASTLDNNGPSESEKKPTVPPVLQAPSVCWAHPPITDEWLAER